MFDGLIEILMSWVSQAFCWLLQQLVLFAVSVMGLVSAALPSIAVPAFLTGYSWPEHALSFIAWIVPFGAFSWFITALVAYELAQFLWLLLYRALMDLL